MKKVLKEIQANFYSKNEKTFFKGEYDKDFRNFIRKQHNGILPNDFIFSTISSLIDSMLEYDFENNSDTRNRDNLSEIADSLVDVYTSDLIEHYKQFQEYAERARSDFGDSGTIEDNMRLGQYLHIDEITQAVYEYVKDRAKNESED